VHLFEREGEYFGGAVQRDLFSLDSPPHQCEEAILDEVSG
jgi:hypothetical protein